MEATVLERAGFASIAGRMAALGMDGQAMVQARSGKGNVQVRLREHDSMVADAGRRLERIRDLARWVTAWSVAIQGLLQKTLQAPQASVKPQNEATRKRKVA